MCCLLWFICTISRESKVLNKKKIFVQNQWRGFFIKLKMEMYKARLVKENLTSACLLSEDSRCCSEQNYFLLSMSHVGVHETIMVCGGLGCRFLCCASQGTMIGKVRSSNKSSLKEWFGISLGLKWVPALFWNIG